MNSELPMYPVFLATGVLGVLLLLVALALALAPPRPGAPTCYHNCTLTQYQGTTPIYDCKIPCGVEKP